MRLQTFTAASASLAIAEARRHLGEDAVIVATHEAAGGAGVRVTAAVEDAAPDLAALLEPEAEAAVEAELAAACAHHGLPADLTRLLLARARAAATPDPAAALAQALRALFRFAPLPGAAAAAGADSVGAAPTPGAAPRRPLLLVGPAGAGKTASVAKLAARARLAGQAVCLITTDVGRAGGVAQLRALAEPLRLDVEVVADHAALPRATAGAAGADLVLVDTAATNPFSGADLARLAVLIEAAGGEPIVVQEAGAGVADAAETAATFGALGARRMLLTKVDAARRLGAALAAARAGLAFSEAGIGPLIGRGLSPLGPTGLARLLLRHRAGETGPGARRRGGTPA